MVTERSRSTESAAWERLDLTGTGMAVLRPDGDGTVLDAAETCCEKGNSWSTRYTVWAGPDWVSRRVRVEVLDGQGRRTLEMWQDGDLCWHDEGGPLEQFDGCRDVDVAATPLTNTLPIRRLGMTVGDDVDIDALWVDVPSLEVRRVRQGYTRMAPADGADRYSYRDPEFGTFELSTDDRGLVLEYEGLARRIAIST